MQRSNGSERHPMSLKIENKDIERLIEEVSLLTGESKTEAVRRSLEERRARLAYQGAANDRGGRLRRFLETEVWPHVPPSELGRKLSRDEEEDILGYGRDGA